MLKSCSRCGKIHDINYKCYANSRKKKETEANKIRKTNQWHKKAEEIKERDMYLCQVCINNLYDTILTFNYKKLEVHHIIPINKDSTKAFDDDNLITLCHYHHKMAENKIIPQKILKMILNKEPITKIKEEITKKDVPPTFFE